ncbi:MAG: hypothetical protein AAF204_04670 [Pseudomonadota bacterium]
MIGKFFQFLDSIEIVLALQLVAAIIFALSLINFFSLVPKYIATDWANLGRFAGSIHTISLYLVQIFYQPLLLLALAEIIKLMRDKKN